MKEVRPGNDYRSSTAFAFPWHQDRPSPVYPRSLGYDPWPGYGSVHAVGHNRSGHPSNAANSGWDWYCSGKNNCPIWSSAYESRPFRIQSRVRSPIPPVSGSGFYGHLPDRSPVEPGISRSGYSFPRSFSWSILLGSRRIFWRSWRIGAWARRPWQIPVWSRSRYAFLCCADIELHRPQGVRQAGPWVITLWDKPHKTHVAWLTGNGRQKNGRWIWKSCPWWRKYNP